MFNSRLTLFVLVALTMIAFAANSLLARLALGAGAIDPASYTFVRLASGAVVLLVLVAWSQNSAPSIIIRQAHWISAAALFVYAAGFSYAYLALDTGMGALILFTMVQMTMIGWGLFRGERPLADEWIGLFVAFGAFVWLVSPGLSAPEPLGTALMAVSGIAWGIYSVRGAGGRDPSAATTANFVLGIPAGTALLVFGFADAFISLNGVLLAIVSGTVTSGLGYALWYQVLKHISSVHGAIVQLTVPALAAAGGVAFIGEPLAVKFALASAIILGGVALAIISKAKRT